MYMMKDVIPNKLLKRFFILMGISKNPFFSVYS